MTDKTSWSGGYPVVQTYLETAQPSQAPDLIDLSLLVAGYRPPREDGRFRYAELGCGTAYTLIGLAALYPEAQFYGVDFMPDHVAMARQFIRAAGLCNIEVVEASFADLAEAPPPAPFDYIALHGVWTWVNDENRGHLVRILSRWLTPGGVCCNGYAAMAGWADTLPLRQIFRTAPRGPMGDLFAPALAAVEAYLEAIPTKQLKGFWDRIKGLPDAYLLHDFGASSATADWLSDVETAFAPAKMRFLAPFDLEEQFDTLRFTPAQQSFIKAADAQGWGETARDLTSRRAFRIDLFGRGTPKITTAEARVRLGQLWLAPNTSQIAFEKQRAEATPVRGLGPDTLGKILAAVGDGPTQVGPYLDAIDLPEKHGLQAALMAVAEGKLSLVISPDRAAALRQTMAPYVAALRQRWALGHEVPGLAAPTLGYVVPLSIEERAAAFAGAKTPLDADFQRLGVPV